MRDFAVLALSIFYITYVVTRSALPPVRWTREWVITRFGEGTSPAYLVTCPWCAGFWIALVVVAVASWAIDVPLPLLVIPAAAGVTGALQQLVDLIERGEHFLEPPS